MAPTLAEQLRPDPDELCVTLLFGQLTGESPMRLEASTESTRAALERLLRDAMQRGPLWIAYSGGRDSSALLAIAAHVARRDGLELPVPVTLTLPALPEADEEDWQRLVLDHLRLTDRWVPLRLTDEIDLLGPSAQRGLRRHGIQFPPNAHAFLPMIAAMEPGATLVSGGNGDEILEGLPQRLSSAALSRRTIPRSRIHEAYIQDLPRRWLGPAVRRRSLMRHLVWTRMPVLRRLVLREIEDRGAYPIRFDRLLQRAWTDREFRAGRHAVERLAAGEGARLLQPFGEHDVIAAFAREWGYRFPGGRHRSLGRLVGDLLPAAILTRQSKAEFARAFFAERTRAWVAEWDGSGVDPERVDVEVLRAEWNTEFPHYCSLALLQHAWLVQQGLPTGLAPMRAHADDA